MNVAHADERQSSTWRYDLDALLFYPQGHGGYCVVHRRAFRTLLQKPASDQECMAYFQAKTSAFQAAAQAKISGKRLAFTANFHLTSRDVSRCDG